VQVCVDRPWPRRELTEGTSLPELAATALARTTLTDGSTLTDVQLAGIGTFIVTGYAEAMPLLRRSIEMVATGPLEDAELLERYLTAVSSCTRIWAYEERELIFQRAAAVARRTGALHMLETTLFSWALHETVIGRLDAADVLLLEVHQLRSAVANTPEMWEVYRSPEQVAWRNADGARERLQRAYDASVWLGMGASAALSRIGLVLLELSHGNYAEACTAARELVERDVSANYTRVLPDLVEAAVRSGADDTAAWALELLTVRAAAAGTPWGLGLSARSQALVSGDEAHYLAAIAQIPVWSDLARAHLLYGEWLRRQKRRREAREQLRTALSMFEEMGAPAFADRARQELLATGETARRRTVDTVADLTPQEATIAALAKEGATNPEIAARLFISVSTVDYHLRKIFRKLGIDSRRQLGRVL
jgi:DNA-binding CsgD family transcriptional regulator